MGDHVEFESAQEVASDLRDRLQRAVGGLQPPEGLIVQFACFARHEGFVVPECWHITNIHGINNQTGEYDPPTGHFGASERVLGVHLKDVPPADLRSKLAQLAAAHAPFWFHQGIDLAVFNTLEEGVKAAFRGLQAHGKLLPPQSLDDWERHARMWVLIYGAYFEAFGAAGERFVGGGADSLSIPWPESEAG